MKPTSKQSGSAPLNRCSRCVLPETYPRIEYNSDGVCNYCLQEEERRREPLGEVTLREMIDQYRGRGAKYDCFAALSGGRDSTFALHYAVKKLGLRVLAFTVDNGFMPEETWESIRNATQILGVDHVVFKHDRVRKTVRPMLRAWLKRPSAPMVSLMCLGCRMSYQRILLRVVKTQGVPPLCITGGGEPEMSFANAFFSSSSSPMRRNLAVAWGMGLELLRNPRYLLALSIPWTMFIEFLYVYRPTRLVRRMVTAKWRYVSFFDYLPYDEDEIVRVITEELKWKPYHHSVSSWRGDCKVNVLRNALYKQTLGFTKNEELVSGLIRRGAMTRDEGLARLERENVIPEQFVKEFFADVGLGEKLRKLVRV